MGGSIASLFRLRPSGTRTRPTTLGLWRPAVPDVRRGIAGDPIEEVAVHVHGPEVETVDSEALEEESGRVRGPRCAAALDGSPGSHQLSHRPAVRAGDPGGSDDIRDVT